MTIGKRIVSYTVICALWAGILFGASALIYDDNARAMYRLVVEGNRETLRHQARMAELNGEYQSLGAEERLYTACMKQHPDLGPEGVDLCRNSAKLDVSTARPKTLKAANK
jgi:hypothetical protein